MSPKGKYTVLCQWLEEDNNESPTTKSECIGTFNSWEEAKTCINTHVQRGTEGFMYVSFHIVDENGEDVTTRRPSKSLT
jgi:hypothetical protein